MAVVAAADFERMQDKQRSRKINCDSGQPTARIASQHDVASTSAIGSALPISSEARNDHSPSDEFDLRRRRSSAQASRSPHSIGVAHGFDEGADNVILAFPAAFIIARSFFPKAFSIVSCVRTIPFGLIPAIAKLQAPKQRAFCEHLRLIMRKEISSAFGSKEIFNCFSSSSLVNAFCKTSPRSLTLSDSRT